MDGKDKRFLYFFLHMKGCVHICFSVYGGLMSQKFLGFFSTNFIIQCSMPMKQSPTVLCCLSGYKSKPSMYYLPLYLCGSQKILLWKMKLIGPWKLNPKEMVMMMKMMMIGRKLCHLTNHHHHHKRTNIEMAFNLFLQFCQSQVIID